MPAVFVLIWSTGFIVAKYGLPYAPPLTFLAIRYFLSIVCFLIWIVLARAAWPQSRQQWLHLAVTGVLMHAAYLGGVWVAVKAGMGSGLTALIVGLQPVLTALWVSWIAQAGEGEEGARVSKRQWAGLALGLGGLLLVVSRKFGTGTEVTALTLACPDQHHRRHPLSKAVHEAHRRTHGQCHPAGGRLRGDATAGVVRNRGDHLERSLSGRHGLVGAGAHTGRQFAALPADSARCGDLGHQPALSGAAYDSLDGVAAVW
jgi:uncharacterized membrane protein